MLSPVKVVDIELSQPLQKIEGLDDYMKLQGLVRLHGTPIGYIHAPIIAGCCEAATISKLILEQHSWKIIQHLLQNGLAVPQRPKDLRLEDLFDVPPPECGAPLPLVTVAVCTRDRTTDLALCLDALIHLDYPHLDFLVVDNAPTNQATKQLVQMQYPQVRYVCEPRPGLDWARNRAIIEAKGEIIAYTDDDVIVDSGWVRALATVFSENPRVTAVTGLVVPYELETEAQVLFEMHGGFGKGFKRRWYQIPSGSKMPWWYAATGNYGTGANMAYRRSIFSKIGCFDPALDVGTVTNGAGDLEMFFRVIKEGYTLVYEPSAMVRHRHRREYEKLRSQLSANGGVFACFTRCVQAYPEETLNFLKLGLVWLVSWHLRCLLISLIHPTRFPRDLIWVELLGCLRGLGTYQKASKIADQITQEFGPLPVIESPDIEIVSPAISSTLSSGAIAVRRVELTEPILPLESLAEHSNVRVYVTLNGSAIGSFDIQNFCQSISANYLCEAIVENLALKLLQFDHQVEPYERWRKAITSLESRYLLTQKNKISPVSDHLPEHILVSIVIATYDRPTELRECLGCLLAQDSSREIEIIVVDNHPASNLTSTVVSEFSTVTLVQEARQGVNYARNCGITASSGDVIVIIDDDVIMPPTWLEKLVAPFSRADVMTVTGNILPRELRTESERLFEQYGNGGLGRGFERIEMSSDGFERSWLYAVPTWELGGTANSAFRASIFSHPEIGLMDEALGPGMPSGAGEDIYAFYKVLKAGYTIIYEPEALVWHKHRSTMSALRHQLFNYSKGIIAYHLTTFLKDQDLRGLWAAAIGLPGWQLKRIRQRFQRQCVHPIPMILLELLANFLGPWCLLQSRLRVKRQGRSAVYIPVSQRVTLQESIPQKPSLPAVQAPTVSNLQQV